MKAATRKETKTALLLAFRYTAVVVVVVVVVVELVNPLHYSTGSGRLSLLMRERERETNRQTDRESDQYVLFVTMQNKAHSHGEALTKGRAACNSRSLQA